MGERFSGPISQGPSAAPRRTGMWSQVCGGPSPSALPQSLLSLQDSGPHPLLLGQRFSNLRRHQNPRGWEKLVNNAVFQVPRGFNSVDLRWTQLVVSIKK